MRIYEKNNYSNEYPEYTLYSEQEGIPGIMMASLAIPPNSSYC